LYREFLAGAQIIFPENGRGLGHLTLTFLAVRSAILATAWLLVVVYARWRVIAVRNYCWLSMEPASLRILGWYRRKRCFGCPKAKELRIAMNVVLFFTNEVDGASILLFQLSEAICHPNRPLTLTKPVRMSSYLPSSSIYPRHYSAGHLYSIPTS